MYSKPAFLFLILITAMACQTKNPNAEKKILPVTVKSFEGNFVTADYAKRNEGYDWIAVTVKPLTDSLAHISVRSRADKKKPTCTFDADATITDSISLSATVEGKTVLFTLSGESLIISTRNKEDEGVLSYNCSGGGSLAGTYSRLSEPLDTTQIDKTIFRKSLSWTSFFFDINYTGNELTIQPAGLTADNRKITHSIEGSVVNAEIGDLNGDLYPEVLVYIVSDGSGSYGSVIGYSVNNGKSMSQIFLPTVADNPEANKGYMGHDEFAVVENTFCQRFPIYKPGDTNADPTGGIRQIQYKLKHGEASWQFVVGKIIEF